MPGRRDIALIVSFWFATVGYVGYRDVWPRLVRDTAPTVWIDLSDEATQTVPVRWGLFRDGAKIGTVTTQMSYDAGRDAFEFTTKFRDYKEEFPPIQCVVPEMEQTTVLSRTGQLREQRMQGTLIANFLGREVARGTARIHCVVRDGELVGHCHLDSDFFDKFEEPLEPTPVPDGQVLNPLQPVNRLRGVKPGLRWIVHEINPLAEALDNAKRQVFAKKGLSSTLFAPKTTERESMIATVGDAPELLATKRGEVSCHVIEIRGDRGTTTVWVRVADGFVMKQVANSKGDAIALVRDE